MWYVLNCVFYLSFTRWRGDTQLPLRSENLEQTPGYGLRIRSIGLSDLGPYSCQAYNGGTSSPDSSTINLKVVGPIDDSSISREDRQYLRYVVSPPTYYQPSDNEDNHGYCNKFTKPYQPKIYVPISCIFLRERLNPMLVRTWLSICTLTFDPQSSGTSAAPIFLFL